MTPLRCKTIDTIFAINRKPHRIFIFNVDSEIRSICYPNYRRNERLMFDMLKRNGTTEQCETCKHKGTRACMYHGYPEDEIPRACSYKLGVHAEEAMRNLNGTFIDVWTPEHDSAVAAKERRQVLDELEQAIRGVTDFMFGILPITDSVNKRALQKWIDRKRGSTQLCKEKL